MRTTSWCVSVFSTSSTQLVVAACDFLSRGLTGSHGVASRPRPTNTLGSLPIMRVGGRGRSSDRGSVAPMRRRFGPPSASAPPAPGPPRPTRRAARTPPWPPRPTPTTPACGAVGPPPEVPCGRRRRAADARAALVDVPQPLPWRPDRPTPATVHVRDSKNPAFGNFGVSRASWGEFLAYVSSST
ncbi:DUF397 domain-containing protein [Streptomyces sp. NPDC091279]|uniref:DUF397 domain-containing protein n=1 Tax=Streptomyces sp. NPDC091279 TaxID=3365983 RepID=UPI003802C657